jgi:hypothetical protein
MWPSAFSHPPACPISGLVEGSSRTVGEHLPFTTPHHAINTLTIPPRRVAYGGHLGRA